MIIELIAFTAGAYVGSKYTDKLQWVKKLIPYNPFYQKRIIKVGDKYALEKYVIFDRLEYLRLDRNEWWGVRGRDKYCLGTLEEIKELAKREKQTSEVVEHL